jgi:thiamine pyrophosphokinase
VTTTGLRYPLRDERLPTGTTRGVSNVFVERTATVSVRSGVVLAIQPEALEV